MATSYITLHWKLIFHNRPCNSLCTRHLPSSAILSIWRMSTFLVEESSPLQLCSKVDNITPSPSHGVVFHLTLHNRYELNITTFWPVDVHLQQVRRWLNVCVPHMFPNRLSSIPPGCLIHSTCDPQLVWHMRGKTPAYTYHQCFVNLLSSIWSTWLFMLMCHWFNIKLIVS
jgi:hypothetical protein